MPVSAPTEIPPGRARPWLKALAWFLLLAAVLALLRWRFPDLDRATLIEAGRGLPEITFIALFLLLPLLGVPVSPFLVVAGLKYGIGWGLLLATIATAIHNLAAFAATKSWFQLPIERALHRLGYQIPRIPDRHHLWFTAAFTGVPGLPYAVKLYSLALTNIRFRIYFWISWPIYSLKSIAYIALGDAAATLSPAWFLAAAAAILTLCYLAARLWKHHNRLPAEEGDCPERR